MPWFNDDITFCANKCCGDTDCYRNPKSIRDNSIPHSFVLFTQCEKWNEEGAEWLTKQTVKEE